MSGKEERTHDHFAKICGELDRWCVDQGIDLKERHDRILAGIGSNARTLDPSALRYLEDHEWFCREALQSAVRFLYYRRKHLPSISKPTSRFSQKIREGRADWVLLEFDIDRSAIDTPEANDLGRYPEVTGEVEIDRCIALAGMKLTDEYDQNLIDNDDQDTRRRQHDRLSALFIPETGKFAQEGDRSQQASNLKMLRQLRDVERIRVEEYGAPLVSVRDPMRVPPADRGRMNEVLGRMGTLGRWKNRRAPLHAVAAARAIYHGGNVGYAFTLNLSLDVRWAAQQAQKAFHSHVQERMRKALKSS